MNILLHAFIMGNCGDDLFIRAICDRYPKHKFYLMGSPKFTGSLSSIKNLNLLSAFYIIKKIPCLGDCISNLIADRIEEICDCSVLIGGSLYIEPNTREQIDEQVRNRKNEFIDGKPFYVLGANFGPYRKREYVELYTEYFRHCTDVCFRESYSYNIFMDLPNIRWEPDILLGNQFVLSHKADNKHIKKIIGVSCIYNDNRSGTIRCNHLEYVQKLVEIIRKYINLGFNIRLFSFCEIQRDKKACTEIYNSLNDAEKRYCEICSYKRNLEEILEHFSECNYIVATRFHAAILSLALDIPVFPIVYSEKTLNALNDYGFEGNYCVIDKLSMLTFGEADYNRIHPYPLERIHESRRLSDRQFLELDRFLK